MSDQRAWVKLWLAWLMDRDIQALSYAEKGRWIELLLLVAEHGSLGRWICKKGVRTLPSPWRRGLSDRMACNVITRLPGVVLHWHGDPLQEFTIEFTHWSRYQLSSSTERVQRWRGEHVTKSVTETGEVTLHRQSNVTGENRKKEKITKNVTSVTETEDFNPAHIRINIPDDPKERREWEAKEAARWRTP